MCIRDRSRAGEKARMNVRLEKLEKKVGQTYSFDSILGESKVLHIHFYKVPVMPSADNHPPVLFGIADSIAQ